MLEPCPIERGAEEKDRDRKNVLESDNVVAGLHVGDALTNTLDNTGTLMSQDNGESTLGVLARKSVGIRVADTSVVDFDSDFMCLWWCHFNVLNGEIFASFPGHGGLASDGLANGGG